MVRWYTSIANKDKNQSNEMLIIVEEECILVIVGDS